MASVKKPLLYEVAHLLWVSFAGGLSHDLADEKTDKLGLPFAVLRRLLGVVLDDAVDNRDQLVAIRNLGQALCGDISVGVRGFAMSKRSEDSFGDFARNCPVLYSC